MDLYHDGMTNSRPPGVPRNTLQGSGAATLDLRWSREFPLRRSDKNGLRLNTAVDVFNVLNRVSYTGFVGNLSSPFFSNPTAAASARRIQLSTAVRF
jgi:hypothetical protein